jgi:hypothetical protein
MFLSTGTLTTKDNFQYWPRATNKSFAEVLDIQGFTKTHVSYFYYQETKMK